MVQRDQRRQGGVPGRLVALLEGQVGADHAGQVRQAVAFGDGARQPEELADGEVRDELRAGGVEGVVVGQGVERESQLGQAALSMHARDDTSRVLLFAVATLLAAIAACVQGTVGFGLALTSAPLLALLDPAFVPGPLLVASLPVSLAALVRERHHADVRGVAAAFVGRVPGTVVGALAVAALSAAVPPRRDRGARVARRGGLPVGAAVRADAARAAGRRRDLGRHRNRRRDRRPPDRARLPARDRSHPARHDGAVLLRRHRAVASRAVGDRLVRPPRGGAVGRASSPVRSPASSSPARC